MGQKTWLASSPLILIQGVLKQEVFSSQMPFLSPNRVKALKDESNINNQILTDFQNSFTAEISRKFATM